MLGPSPEPSGEGEGMVVGEDPVRLGLCPEPGGEGVGRSPEPGGEGLVVGCWGGFVGWDDPLGIASDPCHQSFLDLGSIQSPLSLMAILMSDPFSYPKIWPVFITGRDPLPAELALL